MTKKKRRRKKKRFNHLEKLLFRIGGGIAIAIVLLYTYLFITR